MVGREPPHIPHQARPRSRRHAVPYDPSAASPVDVLDPLAVEVNLVSVVTRKPLDLFGDTALGPVTLIKKGCDNGYASLRRHTGSPAELAGDDPPRSIDQPRALRRSLARSTLRVARKFVGSHVDRSDESVVSRLSSRRGCNRYSGFAQPKRLTVSPAQHSAGPIARSYTAICSDSMRV